MNTNQVGKKRKLALGKGIASLLGENVEVQATASGERNYSEMNLSSKEFFPPRENRETGPLLVSVDSLRPNPYQPRKIFKNSDLLELAQSLEEVGFIQPIVVSSLDGKIFQIISGERRFRAAKMAGIKQVPVLMKRVTDREKLLMAIVENVQRSNLNCVEEALSYFQLMDEFHLSQEEVAKRIGKERSSVANFLRILKLPKKVVELLQREEISFGHAKILAAIKDSDKCTRIAEQVCSHDLSVRQTEKLVRQGKETTKKSSSLGPLPPPFENLTHPLREELEKKTGYHFAIKSKKNGSGEVVIKYNSEDELNRVFEYLMRREWTSSKSMQGDKTL